MTIKRLLAGAGAVALLAGAATIGVVVPAQAAGQTMTVTPNSNLKGGDVVTVKVTGFSPNAPVAIGICPKGRKVVGPGDCGRSKNGASKLTTADAQGNSTAEITIVQGALGNQTPPAGKCPACVIGATNIAKASEHAEVVLNYATTTKPVKNPGSGSKPPLAPTGAREAMITGIAAFVVLQIGLVFFVRATRSAPRRTAV